MRGACVIIVMLLLSGCIRAPTAKVEYREMTQAILLDSGLSRDPRGPDQYYLVVLSGQESLRRIQGDADDPWVRCPNVNPLVYDPAIERARYDGSQGRIQVENLTTLILLDFHDVHVAPDALQADCGGFPRVIAAYRTAVHRQALRDDLPVEIVVEPANGLVTYNQAYFAPIGKKVQVNYTRIDESDTAKYFLTGHFEIVNLGAWNKANLSMPIQARA